MEGSPGQADEVQVTDFYCIYWKADIAFSIADKSLIRLPKALIIVVIPKDSWEMVIHFFWV